MSLKVYLKPEISLIGKTQYTGGHPIAWGPDDPAIGAESVSEFGGRLCFDNQTEVLTPDGWILLKDLLPENPIMTKDPNTGLAEYQIPTALSSYFYEGNLLTSEGRDVSFSVTPEHRQWGCFKNKKMEFIKTVDIKNRQFGITNNVAGWVGSFPKHVTISAIQYKQVMANAVGSYGYRYSATKPVIYSTTQDISSLAYLLTHYISNGTLGVNRRATVIYGRECDNIALLVNDLNLSHSFYTDKRNNVKRIHIGGGRKLWTFIADSCGIGSKNKHFPKWVLNLPSDILAKVWDILVRTDGHTYKNGRQVHHTSSYQLVGQVQEILLKLGFSSSIYKEKGKTGPVYRISKKGPRTVWLNRAGRGGQITSTPYSGMVYCPSTPNGIVFVRRNGKVHFSGNCYLSFGESCGIDDHKTVKGRSTTREYFENIMKTMHGSVIEHNIYTFLLQGVSRSFTHELVRHRHLSFSQLSQRYVDESKVCFVAPPKILDEGIKSEAYKVFLRSCESTRNDYVSLLNHLDQNKTGTLNKKRAREAARAVLPNCTETKIVVSGNCRAWRHFLNLRGSPGADLEIRRVAVYLAKILLKESPDIFQDISITLNPDGMEEVSLEYGSF